MKIVIICALFSFLSPFSRDLLGQRMFAEASLECQKSLGPGSSHVFLIRSTAALCQPLVSFEWTDAKDGGWGGLKVSVVMTLSRDEIDI